MKHLVTCLALGIACAAGAQVNGFEPPYNPDSNADAFIGTHDLMDLLSAFGSAFEPENIYVSTDSMHMLVLAAEEITYPECTGVCAAMGNQWRMANMTDFGRYSNVIPSGDAWLNEPDWINNRILNGTSNFWPLLGSSWGVNFVANSNLPVNGLWCYCATQERPKVEYSSCTSCDTQGGSTVTASTLQACIDIKVQDGWYPLGGVSASGTYTICLNQSFWRWAE